MLMANSNRRKYISNFKRYGYIKHITRGILAHDLEMILRGPAHLRKGQAPLNALQELARCFITEDMCLLVTLM